MSPQLNRKASIQRSLLPGEAALGFRSKRKPDRRSQVRSFLFETDLRAVLQRRFLALSEALTMSARVPKTDVVATSASEVND